MKIALYTFSEIKANGLIQYMLIWLNNIYLVAEGTDDLGKQTLYDL